MHFLKKRKRGAILIEFAFGMPILVLMMYFCLDVPRAYQFINKLRTCSEMAADLITNVYSYEGDTAISIEELKYVSRALEIYFFGNPTTKKQEYGFNISTYVTCVTGTEDGKFKINWAVGVDNDISERKISAYRSIKGTIKMEGFTSTKSSKISSDLNNTEFKDFAVQNGDTKLIVEAFVWRKSENRGFNKQFYMMSLPMTLVDNKFVVVTPPNGLVSELHPPMTESELVDFQKLLDKQREESNGSAAINNLKRAAEEIAMEKRAIEEARGYIENLETWEPKPIPDDKKKWLEEEYERILQSVRSQYKEQIDKKYGAQQEPLDSQCQKEIEDFIKGLPENC